MKGQHILRNDNNKKSNSLFNILIGIPTYGIMIAIIIYLLLNLF